MEIIDGFAGLMVSCDGGRDGLGAVHTSCCITYAAMHNTAQERIREHKGA